MNEVTKFLSIISKYKIVLIVVPIVTVIITFFLVRNLPNQYVSQAQIATGIVDETKQYQELSLGSQGSLGNDQIYRKFSNLIIMMRMKVVLDQLSYQLIIHDLNNKLPFRVPSKLLKTLNTHAKRHALMIYTQKHAKKEALDLWDADQNGLYQILASMRYNSESLNDKLSISRSGESDFIIIQFESENPDLSAFVVNLLAKEFVEYYSTVDKTNKIKVTTFLGNLLKQKSDTLENRMAVLRSYKIRNRVLNLNEQSKQLYTNIVEYTAKKQEAIQNTSSYAGALNELERKFDPSERKYLEATLYKINKDIVDTRQELSSVYDLYYANDLDEKYQGSIDSLKQQLSVEIAQSADKYLNSPLAAKQALVQQMIDLDVKMDLSRYSINSLEREIDRLNGQFDQLVPKEAEVQSFEMGIDIATKEYMDILDKYNQSSLESAIVTKLNVVQMGVPGLATPSKKMLLVILSGIISIVFVVLVLFALYLMDGSIITVEDLVKKTDLPVIGVVNLLNAPSIDLKNIWDENNSSTEILELRNQFRAIRYEVENDLKGKVLIVNSLIQEQGKTFITLSLASAWMMANKKILVIDGNFASSKISSNSGASVFVEDFLQGKAALPSAISEGSLTILKNKGGDSSLIELASYERIQERLTEAKDKFDLILIETAALNVVNQSKEWISFADGIISVFNYGEHINSKHLPSLSFLKDSSAFIGWIMNKMPGKHDK